MTNVVGLRGAIPQGEPAPEVIELLEDLLARARAGEIRSIGCAYTVDDFIAANSYSTCAAGMHSLSAAIAMLQFRYTQFMAESSEG